MCLGMMECVGDLHSQRNAETMKIKGKGTHLARSRKSVEDGCEDCDIKGHDDR